MAGTLMQFAMLSIFVLACFGSSNPQAPAMTKIRLGPEALASVNEDGGALRCEPSVAMHGDKIVVSWNDSFGGRKGSETGVAVAWALSRDRGQTYRFGGYLAPGPGSVVSGADSRLATDEAGRFFLLVLQWLEGQQTLRFYRTDSAAFGTWEEMAAPDTTSGEPHIDKPALAVGRDGRIAIAYDRGKRTAIVTSRDGGKSWSAPKTISDTTDSIRSGAGVAFVADSLVVAWMEGKGMKVTELWSASSSDGGKQFGAPSRVHRLAAPMPDPKGFAIAYGPYSLSGCDACLAAISDTLHLTCVEGAGGGSRILLFSSADRGKTWSTPESVGKSPDRALKIFPSLALAGAKPAVLAYDRRTAPDGARTDVFLSVRTAAGVYEDIQLNTVSTDWLKVPGDMDHAPIQRNFGDYISLASDGRGLVAAWTDGRSGLPRIYTRVVDLDD